MKGVLLVTLSLFTAPLANAAYTCGCTTLAQGAPGYFYEENWVMANAPSAAAGKARLTPACIARFGRDPRLKVGCASQGEIQAASRARRSREAAQRRAPRRETWRQDQAEALETMRRGNEFLEETKRRNREDEINRVLEDARRRGVILPGGYP